MKKTGFLLVLLLITAGAQATEHSESFQVYLGEEVELEGYELRYSDRTNQNVFTVLTDVNETLSIQNQVRGDDIFSEIGEVRTIDEETSYKIRDLDSDEEGLFLDVEVNASNPIFDSADITTDDPSNIFVAQGEDLEITLDLENTGVVD